MKTFYAARNREVEPTILSISEGGNRYHYSLLHCSLTQVKADRDGQFGHTHRHDVYHLVIYLRGKNEVRCGGQSIPVNRGTLLLVDPGLEHDFGPAKKGELEYGEITFEYLCRKEPLRIPFLELLQSISGKDLSGKKNRYQLDESGLGAFMELFYQYGALQKDYRKSSFEIHIKLAEIWNWISKLEPEPRSEELARKAADIICNSLTEKLNLDRLSSLLGYSKTYINREFRKVWNTTPMEYHRILRLEQAAILLRSGDESLKEIARIFAFYDEFHFNRCFQALYGLPPGEFRKQQR